MDRYGVDTGWLRNSKEAVKKGESIIIFPEGKTSKDGNIGEFKSGFVMLSIMTGARIVPFVIDGKYKWYLEGDREYTLVSRWHLQKKANHLLQNIWKRKVKDFVR